eukprot:2481650-Amphidinium_carterae.1
MQTPLGSLRRRDEPLFVDRHALGSLRLEPGCQCCHASSSQPTQKRERLSLDRHINVIDRSLVPACGRDSSEQQTCKAVKPSHVTYRLHRACVLSKRRVFRGNYSWEKCC